MTTGSPSRHGPPAEHRPHLEDRPERAGLPDRPGSPPSRPFTPSAWALGPHSQTLLARFLRSGRSSDVERERLPTPDGDFVDVDWGPDPGPGTPLVLVLHGLEGSSSRGYVRNVCRELRIQGMRPVALNFRGCSGEPNRRDSFYHSGHTDDAALVLQLLRARYPDRPVGAVGFSLGGNILLKLMGERADGGRALLDAAVAMSVPYDLSAGCTLLEQTPMGRAYAAYFLRSLKRKIRQKEDRLRHRLPLGEVYGATTLRRFDELATAPLHGFEGAEHYYRSCSSDRYLQGVRVPTLLLHAEDDPFLPASAIPLDRTAEHPWIRWALQARGGHVGFLEGPPWRPRFWADERSADFLSARLAQGYPSTP